MAKEDGNSIKSVPINSLTHSLDYALFYLLSKLKTTTATKKECTETA